MKTALLVIFCGFARSIEAGKSIIENSWVHEDLNLVGLQENDKEKIYRPCHVKDLSCIRKFFVSNSQCSLSKGPAADPLILERNTLYLSLVNISVVFNDIQISGLNNAEIIDFYVNEYTGNVVLAVSIKGLSERSTDTSFRFHRNGREPVVLTDFTTATFPENKYTAVIPRVPNLQLHKADMHAKISGPVSFVIGPRVYSNTDPGVVNAFATLNARIQGVVRESHMLKASLYMTAFIQNNICDFGQKIITI